MPYLTKLALINEIKKYGFNLKKKEGQCFLIAIKPCKQMVELLNLSGYENRVMEIGAGFGAFSDLIAPYCAAYYLIDIDPYCVNFLVKSFQKEYNPSHFQHRHIRYLGAIPEKSKINIIEADILNLPWPSVDYLISNLPFNITYPFLLKMIENWNFKKAVLILQSEVVKTLRAKVGGSGYSVLSVLCQFFFKEVKKTIKLSKKDFYPIPEVNSEIAVFLPHSELIEGRNKFVSQNLRQKFIEFVERIFRYKNKTYATVLSMMQEKSPQFYQLYPKLEKEIEFRAIETQHVKNTAPQELYSLFLASRSSESLK